MSDTPELKFPDGQPSHPSNYESTDPRTLVIVEVEDETGKHKVFLKPEDLRANYKAKRLQKTKIRR